MKKIKYKFITYSVGDFLIRFKNAVLVNHDEITVAKTNLIFAVAKVLEDEGFASDIQLDKDKNELKIKIAKKFKKPVLLGLALVSRPGLRQYMKSGELESKKGPETYIISTPKGVMSSKKAIKNRVGGEVIAKLW